MLTALHKKNVDVALLDAFVTAAQKSNLVDMKLKVKKIISANSAYGFVLSKEMVRLEYDFKSHISSQQGRITRFISSMTNMLEVNDIFQRMIMLMKNIYVVIVIRYQSPRTGVWDSSVVHSQVHSTFNRVSFVLFVKF